MNISALEHFLHRVRPHASCGYVRIVIGQFRYGGDVSRKAVQAIDVAYQALPQLIESWVMDVKFKPEPIFSQSHLNQIPNSPSSNVIWEAESCPRN